MQLEEALSKAAARGFALTVTEYTFHAPDGYVEPDVEDVYAAAAQPPTSSSSSSTPQAMPGAAGPPIAIEHLQTQLAESEKRAHDLAGKVADLQKQLAAVPPTAGSPPTGDPAALTQADARIVELEAQLSAAGGNGTAGAVDDAPLAAFENYPQTVLALSDKAQKGVNRVEAKTVGDVKTALLTGKLGGKDTGDGKLGRLEVIEVANKLLGQVPAAVGANPPAQLGDGEGMAGIPVGLAIKSWPELLESCRRKETAAGGERQKIEQALSTLQGLRTQQLTPDIQKQIEQWSALHINADKMFALYEAQVSQFLYTLGLPYLLKEVRTVNGSLEKAGLNHLINEVPAPQTAPTA